MLHNVSDKTKRRILLILDLVSICLSFVLATIIRFARSIAPWQAQLYRTILVFLLLTWLFTYTFRHVRGRFYDVSEMDPLENLAKVIRDRFILYVILFIFLVGTKTSGQVSRKFLLYMILLDVGIDYVLRMLYRQILIHSEKNDNDPTDHILLITDSSDAGIAVQRLQNGLSGSTGSVIEGIAFAGSMNSAMGNKPYEDLEGRIPHTIRVFGMADDVLSPAHWGESGKCGSLFNRVYVYLPEADPDEINQLLEKCAEIGVTADVCITMNGTAIPGKMIHRGAGTTHHAAGENDSNYAVAEYTDMKKHCRVLGVNFAVTNVEAAASFILRNLNNLKGRYVCFCNVHTTVMAREHSDYRDIQNHSAYTFADGAPIASAENSRGHADAERCAGPDFMDAVFRATMDGRVGHYFYGSTQETVNLLEKRLKERYPGIRVCGTYSPPFRKLDEISEEEDEADIRRINDSGADIIWIGLGAPKQEQWMALHEGRINGTMFGVGAGFNFYAGNVKRAPKWIQRGGLEWLYRLFQDPKRLFNRYFVTNIKFAWYMLFDRFHEDSH